MFPRHGFIVALSLSLAAPVALGFSARPELVLPAGVEEDLAWTPQALAAPVEEQLVRARPPFAPAMTPTASGSVTLARGKAAAFSLRPLELARVSVEGRVRFVRLPEPGEGEAELRLEEPGIPARVDEWYLADPPGRGSVWLIVAESEEATLRVERPVERRDALAGEAVRARVLSWIDGEGERPPLTFLAELRTELELAAELERELVARDPALAAAARAWRKASALQALARWQPLRDGSYRRAELRLEGARVQLTEHERSAYAKLDDAAGGQTIEIEGPALLALRVRPLLASDREHAPRALRILEAERTALERIILPQPSFDRAESELPFPSAAVPRLLQSGERVGVATDLRLPVPAGRHTYRLTWSGGGVLMRAEVAWRKPWTGEALSGTASASGWAQAAWKLLDAQEARGVTLLRRLLHGLEPSLSATPPRLVTGAPGDLIDLLALALEAERGGDLAPLEVGLRSVPETAWKRAPLLGWDVRLRAASLLITRGAPDRAQELLSKARAFPSSGWIAARAAMLIRALPQGAPLRSRTLAALELAWRTEPLSDEIRTAYRLAWSRASRWRLLGPDVSGLDAPAPRRWLDLEDLGPGEVGGARMMQRLDAGQSGRLLVTGEATHPVLLRAYVLFEPRETRPVTVVLGESRFTLEPHARVEKLEVALPPGEHAVRIEGPSSARAYLSEPLLDARPSAQVAYVHTYFPISKGGKPLRFRIPDAHLPSPVRLHARRTEAASGPITLELHTDVSAPQRIVLGASAPSDRHFDLTLGGAASGPATAVLRLPPLAREAWIVSRNEDAPVVVSLSVRQDELPARAGRERQSLALTGPLLERLQALSRERAQKAPHDRALDRAELLLSIGEDGFAHADLARLLLAQDALGEAHARRLSALLEEDAEFSADRVAFPAPLLAPTLIAPAGAQLIAAADREMYREARRLSLAGRESDAALRLTELYRRTGKPELALEALERMEFALTSEAKTRTHLAPLARPLALALDEWAELPSLRRIRRLALGTARWERLAEGRLDSGAVFALSDRGEAPEREALQKALLGAPWPLEEGRLVAGGDALALAFRAEGDRPLRIETLCEGLIAAVDRCEWRLRVDGAEAERIEAAPGEPWVRELSLARGEHQVELMLARSGATGLARFSQDGVALAPARPMSLTRARVEQGAAIEVLGPTAIRVRARSVLGEPATQLSLRLTRLEGESQGREELLALVAGEDPSFRAPRHPAGPESERTIFITEPGPHRLEALPDSGEALVRMELAVPDRAPEGAPSLWSQAPSALEPLPWPTLPSPLALLPPSGGLDGAAQGLGTFSPELSARAEAIGDGEIVQRPPRTGMELRLGLRRALVEDSVWLLLQPRLRVPQASSPVPGLDAALFLAKLPGRFRTQLQAGTSTQVLEGDRRTSARGQLFLDRPLRLDSDWLLLPSATLTAEGFLGEAGDADTFDREVYWRYGANHPVRMSPALSLRWTPLQDQVGHLGLRATSNSDFQTLDHLTAGTGWSSLLGGPLGAVRASLGYEATYRFVDAHRTEAYLRHGIAATGDWTVWSHADSRLLVFAEDRVLWSAPFGLQNVFSLGVRMDFSAGRGLRDVLPFEEEFEQLLDPSRSLD